MKAIRQSLSRKILLTTVATMVVLLGLSSWLTARDHGRTVLRLEERAKKSFAAFIYNTLLNAMMEARMEDLQKILENTVRTEGIDSLRVVRTDGGIRYSGQPDEIGQPVSEPVLQELLRRSRVAEGLQEAKRQNLTFKAVPLHNDDRSPCFACHEKDGPYLGTIVMGFDFSEFDRDVASSRRRQIVSMGISVVLVVAVVYACLRLLVLRPLFRVVGGARRMAQGDLDQPVDVDGEDEMARLAQHINTLRSHLRENLQDSSAVAEALARAVEELDRSSEQLVNIAMEQSSGAAEQASAVQEATTTSEEMAATSNEISANVESVEQVAEETYDAGIRGRGAVTAAIEGMGQVKEKVKDLADSVLDLGRKSQKIGGIVDIIDEISEQTHLLALNAAIEAAGAGEHGKRFSVVAGEIRRLAERTVEATTQIKSLIEEIQDSTNETVLATEAGTSIVTAGFDRVDKIGESLEGILTLVHQTKESTKEITVATQQQATAGEQLVLTITDINEVAIQGSRSAEQVEKAVIRLKELARKLKELAEENRLAGKLTV